MTELGRPTIYNTEILDKVKSYLATCVDEEYQVTKYEGEKSTGYETKLRVNLPTIEGLASYLGISRDTIYDWEKDPEKADFSYIIKDLRAKQAKELINKGLSGDYNPTIAKVLLTKHGYREGVEQTGKDGAPIVHQITGMSIIKDNADSVQDQKSETTGS